MPDLLLELFSEEIPARMQAKASDDLKKLVTDGLVEAGLTYEAAAAYATPRRLALIVSNVPVKAGDLREEKKGPRVGAPEKAIEGFLKSAGLTSIDQAEIVTDAKKGDFYVARIEKAGRTAEAIIADLVPDVVRKFPWPKSMRWGSGSLRFVRPLQSILCTFGPETEETRTIAFNVDGLASGNVTYGHRFMSDGKAINVRRFDDYVEKLAKAHVVLDPARRRETILNDAKTLAFAQGLELVEDEGLLHEVAGLVEWPVVLMGAFNERFLDIPPEVIRTTIRANQKCFVLRDPKTGKLANRFLLVANIAAKDGGKEIVAGNERVIAARLSDARFFYEQDLKVKLDDRLEKLKDIVFHEKLGTQYERVERIARLARELAPKVGADPVKAERAARLAKADLVTEMVGEFPELQGLMGKYYAQAQGEDASVALAIEEHYKPQGPSDRVPTDPVSIAVALADKLDTLVGFWAIDEKPTGSKDPYALRRAALGAIRIVLENGLRLGLLQTIADRADCSLAANLLSFFADRLKVHLREQGARHDLIDAVFALGGQDDLLMIVKRVEALGAFLDTDDGKNLLAGTKRAANILRIEEKKDGKEYNDAPGHPLLTEQAEKELANVLDAVAHHVDEHVAREDFAGAMKAIAELRPAVDAFFDSVTVNADDAALRENRLKLLNRIRETTLKVADFSRIEG